MSQPDICAVLDNWWGSGFSSTVGIASIFLASNLSPIGGNPLYQVSDFLAFYPKFGTYPQAITSATIAGAGTGYAVNDQIIPTQQDASGAIFTVATIGAGGAVTGVNLSVSGTGYQSANAVPTTTSGTGSGCTLNLNIANNYNGLLPLPVLQAYINLASASLSSQRWDAYWQIGMALFVAHFATLYLQSEGNPTSSAGQAAASGVATGIQVSKAAGDVSVSYQPLQDLEGFGSWRLTIYGEQLATFAKVVGIGPMYVY